MSEKKHAKNGKRRSKDGDRGWSDDLETPLRWPNQKLVRLLETVFEDFHADETSPLSIDVEQQAHDFAFHMTDWMTDFERLVKLYHYPDRVERKAARQFVIGFLIHVIPHLNAAGRLLLGKVSDPFAPANQGGKRSNRSPTRKAQ